VMENVSVHLKSQVVVNLLGGVHPAVGLYWQHHLNA
jgi:hypothetical protein